MNMRDVQQRALRRIIEVGEPGATHHIESHTAWLAQLVIDVGESPEAVDTHHTLLAKENTIAGLEHEVERYTRALNEALEKNGGLLDTHAELTQKISELESLVGCKQVEIDDLRHRLAEAEGKTTSRR
jgi:chromosome segregation ATPase